MADKSVPTGHNFVRLGLSVAETTVLTQLLEHYITTHGDMSPITILARLNDAISRAIEGRDPDELRETLHEQLDNLETEIRDLFQEKTGKSLEEFKAEQPVEEDKRLDEYLKSMDSDGAL